jgi:hypothetical protein
MKEILLVMLSIFLFLVLLFLILLALIMIGTTIKTVLTKKEEE